MNNEREKNIPRETLYSAKNVSCLAAAATPTKSGSQFMWDSPQFQENSVKNLAKVNTNILIEFQHNVHSSITPKIHE